MRAEFALFYFQIIVPQKKTVKTWPMFWPYFGHQKNKQPIEVDRIMQLLRSCHEGIEPVRPEKSTPLGLPLFDRRGDNRLIADGDNVPHDVVCDLDGIALAFFGWFRHVANLPCQPMRGKIFFQSSPLPNGLASRQWKFPVVFCCQKTLRSGQPYDI